MTQEEKAEAYDRAIERAKKQLDGAEVFDYKEKQIAHDIRTTTYAIFPELKESEDEKIRKELIDYLKSFIPHHDCDLVSKSKVWLAWLEKQGEQKPAWSEEDESTLNDVILDLKVFRDEDSSAAGSAAYQREIDWLKSLKDRYTKLR